MLLQHISHGRLSKLFSSCQYHTKQLPPQQCRHRGLPEPVPSPAMLSNQWIKQIMPSWKDLILHYKYIYNRNNWVKFSTWTLRLKNKHQPYWRGETILFQALGHSSSQSTENKRLLCLPSRYLEASKGTSWNCHWNISYGISEI